MVLEDGFGVVEETADKRAFTVVDAAGGGEAEEFHFLGGGVVGHLEVSLAFAVFHGAVASEVVGAAGAFAFSAGCDFFDDVFDGGGGGFDDAGAGHVADGAAADEAFFEGFAVVVVDGEVVGVGEEDAVAVDGEAFVGEVDGGDGDVFLEDVLPDVQFGPVAEGEDSEVFAVVAAAVVEVPEFWSLVFGVPLAEFVAVAEEAFFGSGFFFVASSAADAGVEVFVFDGVEEGGGLEVVAAGVVAFFFDDSAGVDAVLDGSDEEVDAEVFDEGVAEGEGFGEVVAGVDVEEGVGDGGGLEGFLAEVGKHDAVLAAAEK